MDKEPLLKVERLCQYFKTGSHVLKAVDDVSFEVEKGQVFSLVGESGCGKTTTGRSIIRLYDITGGNVYFQGKRISAGTKWYKDEILSAKEEYRRSVKNANGDEEKIRLAKRIRTEKVKAQKDAIRQAEYDNKHCDKKTVTKIQMIFQDPVASLNPRMTVKDIIAEGLVVQGEKDKNLIENKVYEMLGLVGLLPEHANRYPHEFSGGQRQRIGIARSVVMQPELIIADEPVSALDVSIQAQVINLLNTLKKELQLTVLFIAHDLSVVKYFSDEVAVMYFGKIVERASSDELFSNPLHPYTKSLLSAIPLPDPDLEKTRKRLIYNPSKEHDYSVDKPVLREVKEGHFVYCNGAEYEKIRSEIREKELKKG